HVPALELDGDASPAAQFGNPFDPVLGDVLLTLFSRWNLFPFAFTVHDFGLIAFGVDLNFEVMRRLPCRRHRDDLYGFAGRQHAVHSRGADTDAFLAAAHTEPVKFRSVQQLSENEWNLFLDDAGPVV